MLPQPTTLPTPHLYFVWMASVPAWRGSWVFIQALNQQDRSRSEDRPKQLAYRTALRDHYPQRFCVQQRKPLAAAVRSGSGENGKEKRMRRQRSVKIVV